MEEADSAESEARARQLEQRLASVSRRKFSLKKLDMDEDEMVRDAISSANRAIDSGEQEEKVSLLGSWAVGWFEGTRICRY